ncbi:MAG TPA: SRPBCC family protein [Opitutus sp.]|nr:SRPBCC family protein [Opitutus sp.]
MNINDQHGKFTGPAEIRIVRTLPGPIERVWEYLTDPEKRARWFAGGPMELRPGGKMRLNFRHKDIAPEETPPPDYQQSHDPGHGFDGTVLRCEPPRVLAFTFGSDGESVATFELMPEGKNVRLVLTHRSTGGDIPYMAEFGSGWHTHFAVLIALLEGAPRPAFWSLFLRFKADYEKLRVAAQAG